MKVIAGSTLMGLSLVAEVLNEWLRLIVRELDGLAVGGLVGPVFLIWLFMALGIGLLIWGLWETRKPKA